MLFAKLTLVKNAGSAASSTYRPRPWFEKGPAETADG